MASTIALVEPILLVAIRLSGTPTWEATLSSLTFFIAGQGTGVSGSEGGKRKGRLTVELLDSLPSGLDIRPDVGRINAS